MKSFIASFIAKFRGALSKLPLPESLDANSEASYALRQMAELGVRLGVQFPSLEGMTGDAAITAEVAKAYDADMEKAAGAFAAEAEKKAIAEGRLVTKDAHTAAVSAAAEDAKKATRDAIVKEFEAKAEAAKLRGKLVEKGLPAACAEKLPDAALTGEAATATQEKVTARVKRLTELGLKPDNADHAVHFAACAEGLDEAGDAAFALKAKTIEDAKKLVAAGKPGGNPADVNPGKDEKKIRLI